MGNIIALMYEGKVYKMMEKNERKRSKINDTEREKRTRFLIKCI